MLTKKQIEILEHLRDKRTVTDIKEALHISSQSLIPTYLKVLEKEQLVTKQKIGNVYVYDIHFSNPEVFLYLELRSWDSLSKEPKRVLQAITRKTLDPILIFGSYAKGTSTKKSDLDIAIISENKNLMQALESIEMKSLIPLDIHIFTEEEFIQMLNADYENLGKEIARNYKALTGSRKIYALVNHPSRV